jgi:hypothetical protein
MTLFIDSWFICCLMTAMVSEEKARFSCVLRLRSLNYGSKDCCSKMGKEWGHVLQYEGQTCFSKAILYSSLKLRDKHILHYEGHIFSNACFSILHTVFIDLDVHLLQLWTYYIKTSHAVVITEIIILQMGPTLLCLYIQLIETCFSYALHVNETYS